MTAAALETGAGWTKSAAEFAGRHAVPLLALSPAAYVSWLHMSGAMGYDPYVSGALAFAIEIIGYVTVDTLITALHAKRWVSAVSAGAAFAGYISIIVSLNTALNIATLINPALLAWAKVVAEAALVTLSVPTALWAAARQVTAKAETRETGAAIMAANERAESETRQLEARRKEKQDAIAGKIELAKLAQTNAANVLPNKKNAAKKPRTFDAVLLSTVRTYLQSKPGASVRDVCAACSIKSTSTASDYMKEATK